MQDTRTFASLAGEAYSLFERRERDNGETFTTLRDEAPEWLHDLVHDAHGDMLPDDWRYESIRAALGAIHDAGAETEDDCGEIRSEFSDSNVDTYNGSRSAWLASNLSRAGYVDDAVDEFGPSDQGIFGTIGMGQYMESEEIFASVVQSLLAQLDA